jgi:hypothetical protein
MVGRPTTYTQELADDICIRVMSRSLYKVVRDEDMPNRDTIYTWLNKYPDFSDKYARACTLRREERFEAMEEIPDLEEDVQRARLKVDVLKWQLSKEEPRKYSDKLDVVTNGKDVVLPILGGLTQENITDDIVKQEQC